MLHVAREIITFLFRSKMKWNITDVTAAAGSDVKEEESMDVDPQGSRDDYDKVDGVKKYNMREGMQFMW